VNIKDLQTKITTEIINLGNINPHTYLSPTTTTDITLEKVSDDIQNPSQRKQKGIKK
jgi:hypothetical protein